MVTADEDVTDLEKKLIRQVEFYFGDFNLHRDKFMQEEMKKNEGWFPMETMLKFQRLSSICSEPGTILAALKKSKKNLMEIDVEHQKIRRNPLLQVPTNDNNYRRVLSQRTVYVKGFPQTETIEAITEFLEDYGEIDGVQLRRFNNKHTGSMFKGSLFATFNKLEKSQAFIDAPMVYYKDKELEKKTKDAFWKEKEAEKSNLPAKKHKSTDADKEDNQKQEEEVYSWLHVANLSDTSINHLDIKELFTEIEAPQAKFFSRYEKDGPAGYVLFVGESGAKEAITQLTKCKNGLVVSLKSSEEITFSEMTEENLKAAKECYEEFRHKGAQRGKKGKFNKKKRPFKKQHHKLDSGDEPSAKQTKTQE